MSFVPVGSDRGMARPAGSSAQRTWRKLINGHIRIFSNQVHLHVLIFFLINAPRSANNNVHLWNAKLVLGGF